MRSMRRAARIIAATLLLNIATPAAQQAAAPKDAAETPKARTSVTDHSARIGGKTIAYTATAGTMLMEENGKPRALMGFTAYEQKGVDKTTRPIMFAYNGGPGSASLWLHMGVLGPERAVVKDADFSPNGPFTRVDNEYSILDESDLVMIDPVGTGFSRPVGEATGKDFWGVDQDIKSVSEFIVRYLTMHGRWASPKYVLGESYGGMRTGGVAYYLLSRHMVALNGVILVSPFMEMLTGFAGLGVDLPHVMYLPTFAATARYHGMLDPKPADLVTFMEEARTFALTEYAPALLMGSRLPAAGRQAVVAKLARFTGLSAEYWDRANLRISEGQFTQELMRKTGKVAGRIDSRFIGESINPLSEFAVYDPMTSAIGPGYLAAFMDYYRRELEVDAEGETYTVFGNVFLDWDWSHAQPDVTGIPKLPFPNTSVDLAYTMRQNPGMKVLVQQGYYDLATPHLATEYYIEHLAIPDRLRKNIELAYYEAGHMMYVHEPSLVKFKKDLAAFVRGSH